MEKTLRVSGNFFQVTPPLLGVPLASRSRRALAMLIDLSLIAAPTVAFKSPFVPLGALLAGVLYWYSLRWQHPHWSGDRGTLRRRAMVALIVLLAFGGGEAWRKLRPAPAKTPENIAADIDPNLDVHSLAQAYTLKSKQTTRRVLESLKRKQVSSPAVEKLLAEVDGIESDARAASTPESENSDNAKLTAASTSPDASGELQQLRATNAWLLLQLGSIKEELNKSEKGAGILHFLKQTAHDLGIGLGWSGVYFILFPVLWNGRTPGKRLMRIRVVRLNGKPITWWNAFERFHGYVSCLVGGLIGFIQVFWDHQLQGHHDKVAETVVVDDVPIVTAQPLP